MSIRMNADNSKDKHYERRASKGSVKNERNGNDSLLNTPRNENPLKKGYHT